MGSVIIKAEYTDTEFTVPKIISVLDADIEYFNGNVLDYYCLIVLLKVRLKTQETD